MIYGLDGIDFDDEWMEYGVNGMLQFNFEFFGWFVIVLCDCFGLDKIISLYVIGLFYIMIDFSWFDVVSVIDYVWNFYYLIYDVFIVFGFDDCVYIGVVVIDFVNMSVLIVVDFVWCIVVDGYGVYVVYNFIVIDQFVYFFGIIQVLKGEVMQYWVVLMN